MSDYATRQDIKGIKEFIKESHVQLFKDIKTYIDGRLLEQDAYIDSKFVDINSQFVDIGTHFAKVHKEIDNLAQGTARGFGNVDTRFDTLERRLDNHAIHIDKLEAMGS
jgi:hypothetical protein